jgi:hypothetical protein
MRKYTGLWGNRGFVVLAGVLAAGCASAPRTYPVTERASAPPPPVSGEWQTQESAPSVRPDAPMTYVVKKGDTLWDIANHYLLDPWQWPEIWVANSQVRNPHLIYPGDTLVLTWVNGRAQLSLSGDQNKLMPQIRELSLEAAIPTIALEDIRDFLKNPRMVTHEQMERAPYILDFVDPHILGGADNDVYVAKLATDGALRYDVARLGQRYVDPDTDEFLGWEAIPVGAAEVRDRGTAKMPGVAVLVHTEREARVGDRFLPPQGDAFDSNFYPHAPPADFRGRILSVFDGVSQIGQYQVVTLNRGKDHGIEPGHVLSILQAGRTARDPYSYRNVELPQTYAGLVMVFKVDTRVSYALVMKATREVHVLDYVARPTSDQH